MNRPSTNPTAPEQRVNGPLHGVRVLDLSRVLAGPWATQLLGDYGADVIKVERPGVGDDTRAWGPPFIASDDRASDDRASDDRAGDDRAGDDRAQGDVRLHEGEVHARQPSPGADPDPNQKALDKDKRGDATYFLCANRNKRAVAVDFTQAAGQEYLRALAAEADVVVENFKRGGLAPYRLDYPALSACNPRLVYCSITGFGQTGARADLPGYDHVIQAMGGLMSITGEPDGAPVKAGVAVADLFSGMYAATAIMAGVFHARATGEGQHIDIALHDCQLAMLANQASAHLSAGASPGRLGNAHPSIAPYEVYHAADGAMVLAIGNDRQFAALCHAIDKQDLARDDAFATNAARVARREDLNRHLAPVFHQRTRAQWAEILSDVGAPCGPVRTVDEAFADPATVERAMIDEFPRHGGQTVRVAANPVKFSHTPCVRRHGPPPRPEALADKPSTHWPRWEIREPDQDHSPSPD